MSAIGKRIAVTSDLEGKSIYYNEIPNDDIDELIICGDILDSTGPLHNSFNIRNLIEILNNEKTTLILGNRDINKIKCIKLLKLINTTPLNTPSDRTLYAKNDRLIKSFNNGTIEFSEYSNIVQLLEYNYAEWKENILNWPQFWINKESNLNPLRYIHGELFKRFTDVFIDSLGAGSLKDTIIEELNIKKPLDNNYRAFIVFCVYNSLLHIPHNQIPYNYSNTEYTNAIPLQGLLLNVLIHPRTKFCDYHSTVDTQYLFSHGGLTNPLLDDPNILNDYYLKLSGILEESDIRFNCPINMNIVYDFIQKNRFTELSSISDKINYINSILKNIILEVFFNKTNVYLNIMYLLAISANLKCSTNNYFKCISDGRLDNSDGRLDNSDGRLDNSDGRLDNSDGRLDNSDGRLDNSDTFSPILSGLDRMKFHPIQNTGLNTVQVFGHKPHGFAPTIYLLDDHNILLNMDTTNSLLLNRSNPPMQLDNGSTAYLYINNNESYIVSSIKFNPAFIASDNYHKLDLETPIIPLNKDSGTHLYTTLDDSSILNTSITLNKLNISSLPQNIKFILDTYKFINFHGIYNNNYLFTINMIPSTGAYGDAPNFSKHFFIIDFNLLSRFIHKIKASIGITKSRLPAEIKRGIYDNQTNSKIKKLDTNIWSSSSTQNRELAAKGVATFKENHFRQNAKNNLNMLSKQLQKSSGKHTKEKYLKYKNKYLALKQKLSLH